MQVCAYVCAHNTLLKTLSKAFFFGLYSNTNCVFTKAFLIEALVTNML